MTAANRIAGERGLAAALFLHMHGLLALGAAAQRWWIGELGPATNTQGIMAAALATLSGYGYLRLVRAAEPDIIPSAHIHWIRRYRFAMMVLVGLSAWAAVLLYWGQFLVFGPWSLAVVALLGLYLLPLQGAEGRSIGLREIPGLKALLVAAGWTFVTMGITTDVPGDGAGFDGWIAAMQFCFFLALAIATDIGDLQYDRPKLKTIPQVLGIRGAKVLAVVLLLPGIWYYIVLMALSTVGDAGIPFKFFLPLLGLVVTVIGISMVQVHRPKWLFAILLDGMVLLIPLLGLLGEQV
jgi:hypothetical protein